MKELIKIHNQGPDLMADSRSVAKLFGVQHESFRELIEEHVDQLGQLGVFRFETGKTSPNTQGRPEKFCFLNFDQIALLLVLSKPNESTKEFKLRLILAFRDARSRLRPIDSALLTMPAEWKRTFEPDFYTALLRLYGAKFESMGDTPSWVGKWTNRFIYTPLFNGLPEELKRRRKLHLGSDENSWMKLHQFIEKHSKKNLEKHLTKVTGLLEAATSPAHFLELFASVFYGTKQLLLVSATTPDEFG
jgi:hypothetical protein